MLTTVLIAITVDTKQTGTFHASAVSSFLKEHWEQAGLPIRVAQDIRFHYLRIDELADMCNKKALGELTNDRQY